MSEKDKTDDQQNENQAEGKAKRDHDRKQNLSEDRYCEMRQNFGKADEATRAVIAKELANSLYDDIRMFAAQEVGPQNKVFRPTSIAQSTWLKLLTALPKEGALENYQSLDSLKALIRRMVFQVFIDKYRFTKKQPREIPVDDEGNPMDFPSNESPEKEVMEKDIADRLYELLETHCQPLEVLILILRFDGKTYAEIIKELGLNTTPDALRMSVTRLFDQLRKIKGFIDLNSLV